MTIEFRCAHGFLQSKARCPTCSPRKSDNFEPRSITQKRGAPQTRFAPGMVVAGVEVIDRIDNDRIVCKCTCGETFETSRSGLARHNKAGTAAMCRACRTVDTRKRLDSLKKTEAA